jgi:predicted transposase/invertase (TIGR01784 family)
MAEALTNPHDRFFKDLFSRREAAQDFLRHYLPPEVSALLDLDTLDIGKDSFIDPDLQEHFSDLLYQVALRGGQEAYIYVLFEHRSYPDPQIAFQLLRYLVRIWEQSRKQGEGLRLILPLVIYHGPTEWRVALDFVALFGDLPEVLRPFVPDYRYWVCDLSRYSDEEIKGAITLRVGLLLLKYIMRAELGERLGEILGLLRELEGQETGLAYLRTILRYVAGGTERLGAEELEQVVREVLTQGAELMPTIAEEWLERGRLEGLAEGREAGREEGQREAALTLLRRFLAYRFDIELDHFDDDLQPLDLAAITHLSEAAFEVETLAEFEAVLNQVKAEAEGEGETE